MDLITLMRNCNIRSECSGCPVSDECKKFKRIIGSITEPWEMKRLKEEFRMTDHIECLTDTGKYVDALIDDIESEEEDVSLTREKVIEKALDLLEKELDKKKWTEL